MMASSLVEVTEHMTGRQVVSRGFCLLLVCCTMVLLFFPVAARSAPTPQRGKAEIGIQSDLTLPAAPDKITIRIVDNTDRQVLTDIANTLGQRFNFTPLRMTFGSGDPQYIQDRGIGLECYIPVVPRQAGGYLPLAPFLEACAPYVSELQIVYFIQGPYAGQGYEPYKSRDVSLTIDSPEQTNMGTPLAFYGLRAIIKNPDLGGTLSSRHSGGGTPRSRLLTLFGMIGLAGLIGATVGLILTKVLARLKT